jgi:GGDEF domain-containing protein
MIRPPLSLSIGVAIYDATTDEQVEQLVARADAAMYEIKKITT